MSDLITDAMVETAAAAQWHYDWPHREFHREPDDLQDFYRNSARAALEAVAPLIAAKALRDAADAWQTGGWADDIPKGATRPAVVLGMAQRATNWLRARADRIERGEL